MKSGGSKLLIRSNVGLFCSVNGSPQTLHLDFRIIFAVKATKKIMYRRAWTNEEEEILRATISKVGDERRMEKAQVVLIFNNLIDCST